MILKSAVNEDAAICRYDIGFIGLNILWETQFTEPHHSGWRDSGGRHPVGRAEGARETASAFITDLFRDGFDRRLGLCENGAHRRPQAFILLRTGAQRIGSISRPGISWSAAAGPASRAGCRVPAFPR